LRKYAARGAPNTMPVSLPAGATIADLASRLGVTADDEIIVGVNSRQADTGTVLHDGDEVLLVSPMEGG
jgi:sulfur carrier protein ThiS